MGCAWPCSLRLPCQAGVTRCLALIPRKSRAKTCQRSEQGCRMDWLDLQVPSLDPEPNVEGSHTAQGSLQPGWVDGWHGCPSRHRAKVSPSAGCVGEEMLQVKNAE